MRQRILLIGSAALLGVVASAYLVASSTAAQQAPVGRTIPDDVGTGLLLTSIGHHDPAARNASGQAFLEYAYLSEVLIRDYRISLFRFWNIPKPDPRPDVAAYLRVGAGDPDPQPNILSSFPRGTRSAATRSLITKLRTTIAVLEKQLIAIDSER